MSRITDTFKRLQAGKRKALSLFLTAGDPSLRAAVDLVRAADGAGADIIELGVPFSDPLADGPVIQRSFQRAIRSGASVTACLGAAGKIRKSSDVPLVFMIGSTLVINHGVNRFMRDAAAAGVDGLILPDAPPEESDEFIPAARMAGLDTIFLAAPTSPTARLRRIVDLTRGFLYYINVKGVTGGRSATARDVARHVAKIRTLTKLPILGGFGVKTPEQARALSAVTDGVIIGSAAVEIVHAARTKAAAVRGLEKFVRSVRKEMDKR